MSVRFAVALAAILLATEASRAQEIEDVLAKIPAKARAKKNPLEGDVEAPIAGKKLFERNCAQCHGDSAEGSRRGPTLRVGEIAQATPGEIFWILTNGVVRRGMPSWSKLPEPQRWQIIAYLRSFLAAGASHSAADGSESLGN